MHASSLSTASWGERKRNFPIVRSVVKEDVMKVLREGQQGLWHALRQCGMVQLCVNNQMSGTSRQPFHTSVGCEMLTCAAVSGASEPWHAFKVPSLPKRALMDSGAFMRASSEFVGPRSALQPAMESFPTISMATHRPE